MCLLGWHDCSSTALREGGGPAGLGAEQKFRKMKQKFVRLRVFQSRRRATEGKVVAITHLTCICKTECPQLELDQEGVRHGTTHPLGTEMHSSLLERNLNNIGEAPAGTAKNISGAADGLHVLSFLPPHLLKCHGKYPFKS